MPPERSENALHLGFSSSAWPQFEWLNRAIEMSASACAGVLGLTASLQPQAFVRSRASCGDLREPLRRQSEFWSSACAGGFLQALRASEDAGYLQANELPPQCN